MDLPLRGPKTGRAFLVNDYNKKQLIEMLVKVWSDDSFSHNLINKKVITISEGKAFKLSSTCDKTLIEEIEELN